MKSDLSLGKKFQITFDELKSLEEKIEEEKRDWERRKMQLEKELEEDLKWRRERLEKEAKNIEAEVIKEKEDELADERKILTQQHDYDKKLLEQKISDLEGRLKQQISENDSLRSQMASLQTQIKEMAVAALEKRTDVETESSRK